MHVQAARLPAAGVTRHRLGSQLPTPASSALGRRFCRQKPILVCTAKQILGFVDDNKTSALTDWARDRGIQFDCLAPANFQGLRGLVATHDIKSGQLLLSVPRQVAITLNAVQKCPFPDFIAADYWKTSPWFVKLALILLHEKRKGDSSSLAAYLRQLPERVDAPVNWAEEKVHQLQYPYLIHKVKEQQEEWNGLYESLCASLLQGSMSKNEFFWALSCVRSRTFSGPYVGSTLADRVRLAATVAALVAVNTVFGIADIQKSLSAAIAVFLFNILYEIILSQNAKQYAMCPMVDLLNHSTAVQCEVSYDYFQDCYSVVACKSYVQGEQVFVSYGKQSNDSLLQYYGFCEEDNPSDSYVMTNMLKWLDQVQSVSQERLDALNLAGLLGSLQEVTVTRTGFPGETLQALRFLLADDVTAMNLDSFRATGSAELELKVARVLLHACKSELGALGTSIQEDTSVLRRAGKALRVVDRLVLNFRREKKRVLQCCLQQLQGLAA